jgi:hypothetical protein
VRDRWWRLGHAVAAATKLGLGGFGWGFIAGDVEEVGGGGGAVVR